VSDPTDLPAADDVAAWRDLVHAAPDRDAAAAIVRAWATALGCTLGTGEDEGHLIHPPDGLPPALAGALGFHATTSHLHLRPPPSGWAPNDKLPEWRSGR
jgi:hypothetical protein